MSIVLAGTLTNLNSLKDKSLKLVLHTQEISRDQAGELYGMNGQYIKILLSDENILPQELEAVENFVIEEDAGKSPSQRLRGVLYKLWEQNNEEYKIFTDYYRAKMEVLITHFKGKLD